MACGKEFTIIGGVWKKGIEPTEFTATCVDDEFVTRLCPECKPKILCELDGNALCIKKEDFINLQESPAMFIKLTRNQIKEFNRFAILGEKE